MNHTTDTTDTTTPTHIDISSNTILDSMICATNEEVQSLNDQIEGLLKRRVALTKTMDNAITAQMKGFIDEPLTPSTRRRIIAEAMRTAAERGVGQTMTIDLGFVPDDGEKIHANHTMMELDEYSFGNDYRVEGSKLIFTPFSDTSII